MEVVLDKSSSVVEDHDNTDEKTLEEKQSCCLSRR
jgi:hypothetical protein